MKDVKVHNPKTRAIKYYPAKTWELIKNSGSHGFREIDPHYAAAIEGTEAAQDDRLNEEADEKVKDAHEQIVVETKEVMKDRYVGAHWKVQLKAVEEATSEVFLSEMEAIATSKKVLEAIKSRRDEISK